MKYKLLYTLAAFKDLEEIKVYSLAAHPESSSDYVRSILSKLDSLCEFPFLGNAVSNPTLQYASCHYLVCEKHIALYQVDESVHSVYVLRVLSHFQDWKRILDKGQTEQEEKIPLKRD